MFLNTIIFAVILLFAGVVLLLISYKNLKRKRLIEGLATSKIRSLAMGLVEIFGKVEVMKKAISPFTKTDCVYCKYTIEEFRRQGKSSKWVVINSGIIGELFYLKDSTGKVLVDPTKADIDIPISFESKNINPLINSFLLSQNINPRGFLGFGRQLRFREYTIQPNQELFIIGTAGDNPYVKEGTGIKNEHDIMIQKDKNVYLISNKDEKELLKSYNVGVTVTLILGLIFTIIGFALGVIFISAL